MLGRQTLALTVFLCVFIATGVFAYLNHAANRSVELKVGADQLNSEPYEMATAIAHVVGRNYPSIKMSVRATGGSSENMALLASGKLDLALVQADVISRDNVSLLAVLYSDIVQLIVREESRIKTLKDLEGSKIALPPVTSGQYKAFWFLANHYGLAPERIVAIPMNTRAADDALVEGKVDAAFRVRGPRNSSIRVLVNRTTLRFIPIDQGDALQLRRPAFRPAHLPKGSYRGDPPVPPEDLASVSVDRMLVARDDLPDEVIRSITRVLFENRRELALRTPLAALIRQPDIQQGTMLPVHEGALGYFEREKPSFLEEKAELLAFVLSAIVLLSSLMIAGYRRINENKQGRIEDYAGQLLELEKAAKEATDIPGLDVHKARLTEILAEAVDDMRQRRINAEGLQLFSFVWESVNYTINDHEEQLRLGPGIGRETGRQKTARKRQPAKPSSSTTRLKS